jgi:exonuclease SbcC
MKEIAQEPPAPEDKTFVLTEKNTVKNQITLIEKEIRETLSRQAELNAIKTNSEKITQQVTTLDNCPMCKQSVTHEHKHKITTEEKNKIDAIGKSLLHHDITRKEKDKELANLKIRLDNLQNQEKEIELSALRKTHYDKLQERHKQILEQTNVAKNEIENYKQKIMTLEEQTKPLAQNDTIYKTLRQEYDNTLNEERKLAIEHSALLQKEQHIDATLSILQKDITHKETIKKQLENISETTHFLTDYFSPLMDVMERHTLSTIHNEFSTIFQHWFSVLIEETLTARLDEQFTPLISQNGYDTDIAHLSGGERTACALAFRLALCKTVNSLIRTITTKNLLILDEPTDGFSSEQLDKMRDVLIGLGLSQVILVSHEQKIEGMADSIIRVRKENAVSTISI